MSDQCIVRMDIDGIETPVGLDPRQLSANVMEKAGHTGGSLLDIIRANCLECVENQAEVRRCALVACKFWPYRMATNPWRKRDLTDEQREELTERGKRLAISGAAARQARTGSSDTTPSVYKVGDQLITVKQRAAFDILANHRDRLDEIASKTLGVMARNGWLSETRTLTDQGRDVAKQLGLVQ